MIFKTHLIQNKNRVFFLSIYSTGESGSNNNKNNNKLCIACIVKTWFTIKINDHSQTSQFPQI